MGGQFETWDMPDGGVSLRECLTVWAIFFASLLAGFLTNQLI